MSDTQDLDLSFLYEIADGSNEFIVESITMFLQQTPELLQSVDTAINTHDWQTAASAAHKLKPNLGFFGMLNSQAVLQDVEIMCKTGAPDVMAVKTKFAAVKQQVSDNLTYLQKIKEEKEKGL